MAWVSYCHLDADNIRNIALHHPSPPFLLALLRLKFLLFKEAE